MSRSNNEPCANCEVLKLQLELKDSVIKAKDEKISFLSDSLIQTQKELIAAKEEALKGYRELQQMNSSLDANATSSKNNSQKLKISNNNNHNSLNDLLRTPSPFESQIETGLVLNNIAVEPWNSSDTDMVNGSNENLFRENRAYIGHVTEDITRAKLRRSLEDKFGRIIDLDMIISKHCAFVTFATKESYERAIDEGLLFIDGNNLGIEEPRKRTTSDGSRRRRR
ncbi:4490_t:CDS:2 [Ambispora gerdemannii]|uniref:4490_t:CDS:1 n=1 Tax=Ambispora gerdemannii TaxID=144530 RepID=A0A9N8WL90_9GLOM|nr:4490_t:CDS:2 [Ambispora gerdemannii]